MSIVKELSAVMEKGSGVERRGFLMSLVAAGLLSPSLAKAALPVQAGSLPIKITTLNHASFGFVEPQPVLDWYGRVLGMPVYGFQDYGGAGKGQQILRVGVGTPAYMAMSYADPAKADKGPPRRPHFCFGVKDYHVDQIFMALSQMPAFATATLREGNVSNGVDFTDMNKFPTQFNPDIACGGKGLWGDVCDKTAKVARKPGWPDPIAVTTFNNVRMVVPDVKATLAWWTKLTDMKTVTINQKGGPARTILRINGGAQHVVVIQGGDIPAAYQPHLGFGVPNFDPDKVMKQLEAHKVKAKLTMFNGDTPEITVEGPNGVEIQLQDVSYCGGTGHLGNVCPA